MAGKDVDMFEFETQAGKTIRICKFNKIKSKVFRKIRREEPSDQMFTLLEMVADEDTLNLVDDLEGEEFGEFYRAWQADSGVTVGKS